MAYDLLRDGWNDSYFELQACTGAISNELHAQYGIWRDDDRRADLVTVSMGGNNLGFSDVVLGCVGLSAEGAVVTVGAGAVGAGLAPWVGCTVGEEELRQRIDRLVDPTPGASGPFDTQTLPDMYRELVDRAVKPGGHVVVLGYPNVVEESGRWSLWWLEGNRCQRVSRADTAMLRSVNGYLNQRLSDMTTELEGYSGVSFHWLDVSQVYENDATGRHGLCTGEPWVNGLTVGWAGPQSGRAPARIFRSFHPNQKGHNATGQALADFIGTFTWSRCRDAGGTQPVTVTGVVDAVNLREQPAAVGDPLGQVPAGTTIIAFTDSLRLEGARYWVRVDPGGGGDCAWLAADFLKTDDGVLLAQPFGEVAAAEFVRRAILDLEPRLLLADTFCENEEQCYDFDSSGLDEPIAQLAAIDDTVSIVPYLPPEEQENAVSDNCSFPSHGLFCFFSIRNQGDRELARVTVDRYGDGVTGAFVEPAG